MLLRSYLLPILPPQLDPRFMGARTCEALAYKLYSEDHVAKLVDFFHAWCVRELGKMVLPKLNTLPFPPLTAKIWKSWTAYITYTTFSNGFSLPVTTTCWL